MNLIQPNMPASQPENNNNPYPEWISEGVDITSKTPYGSAAGADTKTITISAIVTLSEGQGFSFKNSLENLTSNPTLNLNGFGAKPILKSNGVPAQAGLLKAGVIYTVRYDGTSFILQGEGGEYGTAIAEDVLIGKTVGTDNGLITGTMPDRSGDTAALSFITLGNGNLKLLASDGYRDGVNDFVTFSGSPVAMGTSTVTFVNGRDHMISARGLSFEPKIVVAMSSVFSANVTAMGASVATVFNLTDFYSGTPSNRFLEWNAGQQIATAIAESDTAFEIYSDGFDMTVFRWVGTDVSSGKNVKWIAIG